MRAPAGGGPAERSPLNGSVAAVSCGIIDGVALLDLDYAEDSTAEVDANVVMTGDGGLVEVQATAERTPLSRAHLDELLALAAAGIEQLRVTQEQAIARGWRRGRPPAGSRCRGGRRRRRDRVKLLLATHNEHKRREFARAARRAAGGELAARRAAGGASRCRPRTARRSRENALGKARAAAAATGRVSIADDSGIAAAALGGAPGVRSARYAGEHASDAQNLEKLLREAPAG